MDREITPRQLKAFERFLQLLPHGRELDLVILKAHLLIEEQLNLLIASRLSNPDVLLEEKFESYYRILLAQSFFESDFRPWLWKSLLQLNTLRNRIAHSLAPKGISHIIDHLIQTIPGNFDEFDRDTQVRFEFALWSLFDAVSELVVEQSAKTGEPCS